MFRKTIGVLVAIACLTGCAGGQRFSATVVDATSDGQVALITAVTTKTNIHVKFVCGQITERVCASLKPGDKFTATSGPNGQIRDVMVP